MPLEKYRTKRKFEKTSEPRGKVKAQKSRGTTSGSTPRTDLGSKTGSSTLLGAGRFVVQEHDASHLHWDFRLELPEEWDKGSIVLKSWAVPKGVPIESGIKHLAVQTEDHPIEYINFKGIIPEGNYGAGTVVIWDSGKFKSLKVESKNSKVSMLEFTLVGKKLKGNYVMVKTNFAGNKNSWLIFKR